MVIKTIVQEGKAVLRQQAQPVPEADFGTPKLHQIITDMSETLATQDDGVAIAAPQIGLPLRIFVVSSKILPKKKGQPSENQVYINPVIKKMSQRKIKMDEGCLSVRWIYGKTKRADQVTVEAYNEKGFKFVRQGSGIMAQIFQHEIDHLDGVLFIDKATNLEEVKPGN